MFRIATITICAAGFVFLSGCISQEAHRSVLAANEKLQEERDALAEHVRQVGAENDRLSRDVQRLGASAADAAWIAEQKQRIAEITARLQGANGGTSDAPGLDIRGVSVRQGAEGIIVQVQGEVLFASGQAELTDTGRRTLDQILPELRGDGQRMRIEGHTDSDPIVRSRWRTNLRLSSERALSVAEYLTGAGLPADHIAVSGYGEHRPIQVGTDDASKAANRRVEILLLDR